MLTFVMPVRHQNSVSNWDSVRQVMAITFASIANQDHPDWRAVVVANEGAHLPPLPPKFSAVRVDIPYFQMPGKDRPIEDRYNATRDDKGRRVWAGIQTVSAEGHFMMVDYDDLVSRRLATTAAESPDAAGWYIESGYRFDGSPLVIKQSGFNTICGTSQLIHARHYFPKPGDDHDWFVRHVLGSHRTNRSRLEGLGDPLVPLPYRGAMYRVGHSLATSASRPIRSQFTLRDFRRAPRQTLRRMRDLGLFSRDLKREFMAG